MDRDGVSQLPVMVADHAVGILRREDILSFLRPGSFEVEPEPQHELTPMAALRGLSSSEAVEDLRSTVPIRGGGAGTTS
jgi:hypothetical protein